MDMEAEMFNQSIADKVCDYIVAGKGLRAIGEMESMPSVTTIMRWCREHAEFRQQYAYAREIQAELMLDEILAIADNTDEDTITGEHGPLPNHEWITRSKVRVDARKWAMSKLAPKKWGDSKAIDVTSGGQRVTGIAIVDYQDDSAA